MELLLSSGAHPFVGLDEDRKWLLENLLDTGANPLFRCVVQNIPPLWAKEPLSEPFGDGGLRAPDRDSATACMARMENAVRLIFDWFGQVRDEKERARWRVILESREFVEMLGVVGDAFVETVARWYLKTIRVRLTPEEQRSLLWSDEVDFETPYVWDPEWIPTADNEDEEIDSIFWRDGLSGRELLAVLKQKRLRLPGELRWMWARKILTPERLAQVEEDIKIERYDEEGIEDFELRDEECLFELVVRKRAFSTRDSYRSRSASIDSSDSGGPGEIIP
ncbi:hypothetical protein B0T17DRAFT_535062 [Bombardia bombarda]|uniref:Uncharacterized protein n=1 Tax=Bombardia bombarda TaxID=252184 RepID=A0AA39WUC5_9PEZI|nr:hypothetical protein B0T17DRAFT_535062 [Bombardia bombarda]